MGTPAAQDRQPPETEPSVLMMLMALVGVALAGPDAGSPEPVEGDACAMERTVWPDGKPVTGRWVRVHQVTGGTDGERHELPEWGWGCGPPKNCERPTILCRGERPCVLLCAKGGR